ncbi:MAG: DegV family protein [Ruminococcus sp.]|nr:DegV family protein [Ruminococcus sp.]
MKLHNERAENEEKGARTMREFVIFTDGPCDLTKSYCEEHNITVIPLYVSLDGGEPVPFPADTFDTKEFYAALRQGKDVKTSAPSIDDVKRYMQTALSAGKDILYAGFSAKLSATFNTARLAAEDLKEQYPAREILCLDTKCASLGQGLFVDLLVQKRESGVGLEETFAYGEQMVKRIRHWFTVDDLMHLKRGGRVSGTTAILGTMLQIKPILRVNEEGGLEPYSKIRGRRAALKQLADYIGENMVPGSTIAISHGDCEEDLQFVRDIMRRKYGVKKMLINLIDPVVGAHSGPGTLAVFYVDKNEE